MSKSELPGSVGSGRRPRRRVTRLSPAGDYDRTADRPDFQSAFRDDGERVVELDTEPGLDEAADQGSNQGAALDSDAAGKSREFYEEERPPHYGG